ncbi:MAG: Ig-like domain-containing protein [Ferruginibacter sp.]|nr:Ig-like domain-containing protein [Ferruginibacter sp.]
MRPSQIIFSLFIISLLYIITIGNMGCGQVGMPTGGPKDSIPPRLVNASPALQSTNVTRNTITLTFNEYIELKEPQTNVLISPLPKKQPSVDFKLKTVTVKLKDTLLPNTTYSINFGNAIVDNNEGNPLKDFVYVFSTGPQIDSFTVSGKVIIAETGKTDSTLLALLYRKTDDSAVRKNRPDYAARLSGDGSFTFVNLPAGNFNIYALKDGDGGKTYNSKKEIFAFADAPVTISANTDPVILYASALEKENLNVKPGKTVFAKRLSYNLTGGQSQDIQNPLEISFTNPLKKFEAEKFILRDTNYKPVPSTSWTIDSTRTKIKLTAPWQEAMDYRIIIDTTAVIDSANLRLIKKDTIRFTTKQQSDYGNAVLRFSNLDLAKSPVLQLVQGEEVKKSYPLTTTEWSNKFVNPGDYEIRILFDDNKNGRWDPGDFSKKLQPEKVITLKDKLAIKANWDNERDIKL